MKKLLIIFLLLTSCSTLKTIEPIDRDDNQLKVGDCISFYGTKESEIIVKIIDNTIYTRYVNKQLDQSINSYRYTEYLVNKVKCN